VDTTHTGLKNKHTQTRVLELKSKEKKRTC